MPQAKLTTEGAAATPSEWFEHRREDYSQVLQRLARVRRVTLTGDLERAAENLRRSYLNAVMSIKTDKDRHERAFTAYLAGDKDLREAMSLTVYGNQKADWAERTLAAIDWANVALAVRAHVRAGRTEALLGMADHDSLVGVSHTKWAFTLAMSGVWEVACVDSNVARNLELGDGRRHDADSAAEYAALVGHVREAIDAPVPPFLAQWAIYDFERGEHARHMPFFREVHM